MIQRLSLRHYAQTHEGACLPACARMVLAFHEIDLSESEIVKLLGSKPYGTPSFAVQRLEKLEVRVIYQEWSIAQLLAALQAGHPVILFARTAFLEYWQLDVAHAIVVVGAQENRAFWVHDPAFQQGPQRVSWDGLLAAWAEFSYRGAVITPR